jgi:hypothetical protein
MTGIFVDVDTHVSAIVCLPSSHEPLPHTAMPCVADVMHRTTPLARRRPVAAPTRTVPDPDSSSIAGRRASGFLQVSLSKVTRHHQQGLTSPSRAEAPPMNASDFLGVE